MYVKRCKNNTIGSYGKEGKNVDFWSVLVS